MRIHTKETIDTTEVIVVLFCNAKGTPEREREKESERERLQAWRFKKKKKDLLKKKQQAAKSVLVFFGCYTRTSYSIFCYCVFLLSLVFAKEEK